MKICYTCKIEKPSMSFSTDLSRKDCLQAACKSCKKVSAKQWNEKNKESEAIKRKIKYDENKAVFLKRQKDNYYKNPEKSLNKRLKHKYGISLAEYNDLLSKQNEVCAICQRKETDSLNGKIKRLSVDHCRITGMVRGLLCNSCNGGIGLLQESPNIIERAKEYVTKNIIKTQF